MASRVRRIVPIRAVELGLALLALAAGGYIFITTVVMVVECWTAVPFGDQWDDMALELDKLRWDSFLNLWHWLVPSA